MQLKLGFFAVVVVVARVIKVLKGSLHTYMHILYLYTHGKRSWLIISLWQIGIMDCTKIMHATLHNAS